MSENGSQDPDGQISYELYFPAPINQSKVDSLRYHTTTRNVFALLYQRSLVGLNLLQALTDLHDRLQTYLPPETDSAELVMYAYLGLLGHSLIYSLIIPISSTWAQSTLLTIYQRLHYE